MIAVASGDQQDVRRLDVTMHEPEVMGVIKRRGKLLHDRHGSPRDKRPFCRKQSCEIDAVDELHGHEQRPAILTRIEHRHHMRVNNTHRQARLTRKPPAGALVIGKPRRDDLQRHNTIETQLTGTEHRPHRAHADHTLDPVTTHHIPDIHAHPSTGDRDTKWTRPWRWASALAPRRRDELKQPGRSVRSATTDGETYPPRHAGAEATSASIRG